MNSTLPPIDPSSHRAAIDALEAQRAAYRRFARQAEAQQGSLASGNGEQAAEFTEGAIRIVGELDAGARKVRALVDHASAQASDAQLQEIERTMNAMMTDARGAEAAIRNLTTQLEAWRDAYGRQLADIGVTPGGTDAGGAVAESTRRRESYGNPGFGAAPPAARSFLLDRKG